jgi:hypothetical protein
LRELETYYSYTDAMDLDEVIVVDRYNEWVALEAARGRR